MSKVTIFDDAANLIFGDREKDYGHPVINFKDIANLWSAYLLTIKRTTLTPNDVAFMMMLLKMARAAKQASPLRDAPDSIIDMAGYLGCIERFLEVPDAIQRT